MRTLLISGMCTLLALAFVIFPANGDNNDSLVNSTTSTAGTTTEMDMSSTVDESEADNMGNGTEIDIMGNSTTQKSITKKGNKTCPTTTGVTFGGTTCVFNDKINCLDNSNCTDGEVCCPSQSQCNKECMAV